MKDEYVRKQDAVDMFNRAVQDVGILDADDIEIVFGMLSSADVVPVVRCKDCKHLANRDETGGKCWRGSGFARIVGNNDFCSYGERREG